MECTEDFYRELYELFEIARSWYLQAEKNHMKTEYFIELFERSHQYIDCDCARCKNSRQMAIGIIGTLFRDSKCVSIIKKKEDYSAHPTNPVEGCADANPKTELPNDT